MGKRDDAREAWGLVTQLFMSDEMNERFHQAVAAAALPHPGALRLLLHMKDAEPPSMRDLAAYMQCDASWVTALVDDLEHAGLVERRVSATDRRVRLVHVTAKGAAARLRAREVLATPPKAMDRLTAVETKQLARLLRRIQS